MAGAIDLFAGYSPIAGPNLFAINKDPLQQLDEGVEDVIGQQAGGAGNQLIQALQSLINSILGFGLEFLGGAVDSLLGDLAQIDQFFTNTLKFLGELDPLSPSFNIAEAAQTFLQTILIPTNLVAPLVEDASTVISGITGFVPMANLDTALLSAVVGGAQAVIDAILETVGIPAGSGTETQVNQYFTDLLNMLANPTLTSGSFDPVTAVENFITDMIHPTNLLAPLVSGFVPQVNIPSLTSSWAGTVAGSLLTGNVAAALVSGALTGATIAGSALTSVIASANVPALPAGWGKTIDGSLLNNAITNATLAGSQLSSAITNQNYIPALTAAWTNTIDGAVLSGEIASTLVSGVVQASDIGAAVENHVDAAVQAIYNNTVGGNSLAQFYTALNSLTNFLGFTTTGKAPAGSVAGTLAGQGTNKPLQGGLDPTTDGPFDITQLMTGATLPTVAVTQANSLICFVTTPNGGVKQSIRWLGYGLTNITAFYVNVYQMNATTGVSTLVYSSPNIVGSVGSGSTPVWNSLNLPTANFISTTQGNIYALEIVVQGTGTYNVVGVANVLPTHPTAIPAKYGATRSTASVTLPVVDSIGAGLSGGSVNNGTYSFAHNGIGAAVGAGGAILVYANVGMNPAWNASISIGGQPMTNLTGIAYASGSPNFSGVYIFGLLNPPTGNQTITVNQTAGGAGNAVINSVAWRNVSGMTAGPSGTGSATAMTTTITTAAANQVIAQAFGALPGATFTGYNQTSDWLGGTTAVNGYWLQIGHATGAASVTFNETKPSSTYLIYGSASVILSGPANIAPPTFANPASGNPAAYSNNTPWIGMASSPGATTYSPVLVPITASGNFDPTQYAWANFYDVILSGGGGSGRSGDNTFGGNGGGAGAWNTETVTKAQAGTSPWTFTIGGGGAQISVGGGNGNFGAASSVSIPGYSGGAMSAAGGAAGVGQSGHVQGNPGANMPAGTWTDYYGNSHSVPGGAGGASSGQFGGQPGAGGAGGQAVYSGPQWPSGGGGNGIGYVYVYQ